MLESELSTILKIVSREKGTCGWYQIDRELVREGIRGIHVRNALDTLVARELISVDGDVPRLEDLESTNGTFLNRETIAAPAVLQDGDVVRVGSIRLTFRMLSEKAGRTRRLRRKTE